MSVTTVTEIISDWLKNTVTGTGEISHNTYFSDIWQVMSNYISVIRAPLKAHIC